MHQAWFIEWAELESVFRRKDIAQTKAFLSSGVDVVRPPYGRTPERMKRQSIIVGTTNQDEFLSDSTGNRRFWVIPVKQVIDLELLRAERDQIWGAAVAAYKAGAQWWLTAEEEQEAAELNQNYQTSDPWQSKVETYLRERRLDVVTTSEVLTNAVELDTQRQGRPEQMRVADILKALGWKSDRKTYKGRRQRLFSRPQTAEIEAGVEVEDCDRNDSPTLTEHQLTDFMNWNLDQPDRYQVELAFLTPSQTEYLYQRLPELRPQQEDQRCLIPKP